MRFVGPVHCSRDPLIDAFFNLGHDILATVAVGPTVETQTQSKHKLNCFLLKKLKELY